MAALRERGHEVHGVARRPVDDLGVDAWHAADLLDPAAAPAVVGAARASHLLHLAWTTEHGRFWYDPANLAWAAATLRLVEAFAAAGGTHVVTAGSCAQYAWDEEVEPMRETATPRRPATLYGRAKEAATGLVQSWADETGLSHATALLFFPYGPHEAPERLVPSVARRLLAGEPAPVTSGTQVRDFVHVADCGAALAGLLDSGATGPVNIGSGRGVRVADVATTLARLVGREELLRIGALPGGDDSTSVVADTRRLRDEVGFVPRHDLESGLHHAVEWWRSAGR